MDTFSAHQFDHVTVLGKQRNRRGRLAFEDAFEVFGQRKTGTLHFIRGIVAAQLGALDKLLRHSLHGAQHLGRGCKPDHLQRTHRLVQLLTRNAELTRVQLCQIRAACQFCVAHEPAHGFGGTIQRFFQLVKNPGQWAQIVVCHFIVDRGSFVRLHGFVHSCE